MLPPFLTVFVEHALLLTTSDPPAHEYAALARTCKEAHALLRDRLRAQFRAKHIAQLDFVDRFVAAHAPATGIAACIQRRWDRATGTVTLTTRALATEGPVWRGLEFTYTYDPARSAQSNYESLNRQKNQAILDHISAYVALKTRESARRRARFAMLAAAAAAVAVLARVCCGSHYY